ncbi:MAG: putative membrane protein, partial [Alphaproteobacteria bacterium]
FILEKTRVGAQLTAAVIAILGAIIAANVGLIPQSAPAYGFVFQYIVPMLVPLFLFTADLRKIFFGASRMTFAFLLASIGTVTGVTLAVLLFDFSGLGSAAGLEMSQREPAIAGLFASTFIGGSVNFAAMGEVTGLSKDQAFFSAATAADNLLGVMYLALLALMPGWAWLARRFAPHDVPAPAPAAKLEKQDITAMSLCLSLAGAMVMVVAGDALVALLDIPAWRYVIITSITLLFATAAPRLAARLAGSYELGVALSLVFFAAIAAGADVRVMVEVAPMLIGLVAILLTVHALITFGIGSWLRLSLPELIIASNAAILGATTAPALAAAKGWRDLVTPGVLVGVFGYAIGTYAGTLIFKFWHYIL